jgi:hypothetical protein
MTNFVRDKHIVEIAAHILPNGEDQNTALGIE